MTDHPTDGRDGRLHDGYAARVDQALRSLPGAVRAAVVPPQPASIRRRAERRAVHRAVAGLAAAAAVVASVTGIVAMLPAHHDTKPPTPASPSVAPTASPISLRAAALQPADLGGGYSVADEASWSTFPDPTVPGESCGAWRPPASGASAAHVQAGYYVMFKAPRGHFDGHEIWRFDARWAATAIRETRDRLRLCPRVQVRGDQGGVLWSEWTLLDSGFAGTDSLAVRHRAGANGVVRNVDFYVLVRHGDLVGSLWLSDQRWTAPRLRDVGRAMAARLCAADRTC